MDHSALPSSSSTLHESSGYSPLATPLHDPHRADLSFPEQTTNTRLAGFTDEYRAVTRKGTIPANQALKPIPSRASETPAILKDTEKALALKDVQLVTWKENDPEDPRQWSRLYRWCESHKHLVSQRLAFLCSEANLRSLPQPDITAVAAIAVVAVAFGSAVVTGDFKDIEEELHSGEVVVALSVSLMVVGFGLGPLMWSPLVSLKVALMFFLWR
jgi:hypothetical protein